MRLTRGRDLERGRQDGLALALTLDETRDLTYAFLREVADAVAGTAATANGNLSSLFLVVDRDVAKSVGGILKEELGLRPELIALDGIEVGDLDFIDIGQPDRAGQRGLTRAEELIPRAGAECGAELQVLKPVMFNHVGRIEKDLLGEKIVVFQLARPVPRGHSAIGFPIVVFAFQI